MIEQAQHTVDRERSSGGTDLELFESLLGCQTVASVHATTARIANQLGCEHFIYGVRINIPHGQPYQFVLNGYPKEWRSRYIEAAYENIDPTVFHCIRDKRITPLIWNNQVFRNRLAAKLWGEAREFGLTSGASFPVQGRNGESAMLSLATSRSPRHAKRDILATLGTAQLLTSFLHDTVQHVVLNKLVNLQQGQPRNHHNLG